MSDFRGVIIEESLGDKEVLNRVKILNTRVEKVTEEHNTPHLKQWTLHTVEIPKDEVKEFSKRLSESLDSTHNEWYADFKNHKYHYIIFKNKVFKVERGNKEDYEEVVNHGISLGIPNYQLDFTPETEEGER